MSSRAIRPRTLDVTKKLQIKRVEDVTFKDGDKTYSALPSKQGAVKVVESKKEFIPTPMTQKISSAVSVARAFRQPVNYLHFTNCTGAKVITAHDRYDLLQEDIDWMKVHNLQHPKALLNEDALETLIDLFEKQAWLVTKQVDPSTHYPHQKALKDALERLNIRAKVVSEVYMYWKAKRLKLDKALMRKFQQPPPHEDNNPHVAFRQRVPETGRRVSYRNPKKNDQAGYQKMRVLRKDFDKLMELVDSIREREYLKRDSHLINTEIFDKRIESALNARVREDPLMRPLMHATIPKCPAQRKPESMKKKRDKPRKPKHRVPREKLQPVTIEVSDDDVFSETDDSDREYYDVVENMLLESKMQDEGLSPKKVLPETGFPAPHWLPGWEEIIDEEMPTFVEMKRKKKKLEKEKEKASRMELDPLVRPKMSHDFMRRSGRGIPVHKSYQRHRGRFCGRIGRGGRLFFMIQSRNSRGDRLDDVDDLDDEELMNDDLVFMR